MLIWLLSILTLTDSVIGSFLYQQGYGADVAIGVIYVKYVVFLILFGGFLVNFARDPYLYPSELTGLLYLVLTILLSLAIARAFPDSDAITRLYIYYFPVIIYFAGSYVASMGKTNLTSVVMTYAICYIALNGLFGFQYYTFGGDVLWRDVINYSGFVAEVKGFSDGVINGLPGNFYYDPYNLQVPRFVGSMGDPLAVAYSGIVVLLAVFWTKPRLWQIACAILLGMIVATLTRAVFLGAAAGIGLYWAFGRRAFVSALGVGLCAVVAVLAFGDAIFNSLGDSSTGGHVDSISQIYDFLNPTSILFGALRSGDVPFFEPGMFNILFSFGIVPFVLFLLFMGGSFVRNAAYPRDYGFLAIVALGGVFTLMVMSSSFLAVTSSWFAWFCFGFASGEIRERSRREQAEAAGDWRAIAPEAQQVRA